MVSDRIKQLRKERGLSITELARIAGVSKSYLSYIERDVQKNPSLQFLSKIAKTLNTTIEFLLGETEENEHSTSQIDEEWIVLIKRAMDDGVSKEEFQNYIEYIKFKKWEEQFNRK